MEVVKCLFLFTYKHAFEVPINECIDISSLGHRLRIPSVEKLTIGGKCT